MTELVETGPTGFCLFPLLTQSPSGRWTQDGVVGERGNELSCCKPQLSLMRDRDKRLLSCREPRRRIMESKGEEEEEEGPFESLVSVGSLLLSSFEQSHTRKTNGLNSFNNCKLATLSLNYFGPSVPFLSAPCSETTTRMPINSQKGELCPKDPSCNNKSRSQDYFSLQYVNNNDNSDDNNNGIGRRQFFLGMVKRITNKFHLTENKRAGKGSSSGQRFSRTPFILLLIISCLAPAQLICLSGASPIPQSSSTLPLLPTQRISYHNTASPHVPILDSEFNSKTGFTNQFIEPSQKINPEQLNNRTRDGGKLSTRSLNDLKLEYETSGKVAGKGPMELDPEKPASHHHTTKPLIMELKQEPLMINSKSYSLSSGKQEAFTSLKVDPGERNTNKNNNKVGTDNDDLDEDDSEYGGEEKESFVLINNSNNNRAGDSISSSVNATWSMKGTCLYRRAPSSDERNRESEDKTRKSSSSSSSSFSSLSSSYPFTPFASASIHGKEDAMVWCKGARDLAVTLDQIPHDFESQVVSILVRDSSISSLNLTLFERFPRLVSLSVTHSNVTEVIGNCPEGLQALNISFNAIRNISSSVFLDLREEGKENGESEKRGEEETDYSGDDDTGEDNDTDWSGSSSNEKILPDLFPSPRAKLLYQQLQKNKSGEVIRTTSEKIIASRSRLVHPATQFEFGGSMKMKRTTVMAATPVGKTKQEVIITSSSLSSSPENINYNGNGGNRSEDVGGEEFEENDRERSQIGGSRSQEHKPKPLKVGDSGEERGFSGARKTTNEDERNNENDPDNDPEIKRVNLENKEKRKGEESSFVPSSSPVDGSDISGTVVTITAASEACPTGNNNNSSSSSLCKPNLLKVSGKGRIQGGVEDVDEEEVDHILLKRRGESGVGFDTKSESYTDELDQEVTSETDEEDYSSSSLPDQQSNVLSSSSSAAASTLKIRRRRRRSDDDDDDGNENEIKVGGVESTSSQHQNNGVLLEGILMNRARSGLSLQDVDLSHNKISEVPTALLELKSLNSLRLSGNQLKCDFVWDKLADWYMESVEKTNKTILKDGDDTFCGVVDDVRVFQFTVLGVLKAKKDVVDTCNRTVDKSICHECGLYSLNKVPGLGYNVSHESPHGNVAIALKLDCSFHNLTDLPPVPPQTWQLNVSGNSIKDLSSLKEPMYENLLILDADSNEITSLDSLTGTTFLEKYNYLSLQNNRFSVIPSNLLSSLKNMRGQGVTFLGANFIDCDCDVMREIKPLLLENSKKIKDLREIYCKDMKAPQGDTFTALKDVQYTELCYMESEESSEIYLYLIILVELLLIFVIVAKVWHDQRTFRRTGILPWCSAKMPRLPCDAMLESVKEPPSFNRSSSMNVRSFAACGSEHPTTQSISSHVQLREVRSNSGQSEKSSQISQLSSSFPSSSRTSSV